MERSVKDDGASRIPLVLRSGTAIDCSPQHPDSLAFRLSRNGNTQEVACHETVAISAMSTPLASSEGRTRVEVVMSQVVVTFGVDERRIGKSALFLVQHYWHCMIANCRQGFNATTCPTNQGEGDRNELHELQYAQSRHSSLLQQLW